MSIWSLSSFNDLKLLLTFILFQVFHFCKVCSFVPVIQCCCIILCIKINIECCLILVKQEYSSRAKCYIIMSFPTFMALRWSNRMIKNEIVLQTVLSSELLQSWRTGLPLSQLNLNQRTIASPASCQTTLTWCCQGKITCRPIVENRSYIYHQRLSNSFLPILSFYSILVM